MSPKLASSFSSPRFRILVALFVLGAFAIVTIPEHAYAGSSGGRIYNPKRLRAKKEPAARGRTLKDQRQKPPVSREPARAHAEIPNPEPHLRGGSGYSRRGSYFYENPRPIRTIPNSAAKGQVGKIIIPHPNKKER
ncbi:MAG: hypothetical protein FJ144_24740 [Deltaproteobacteria bacterium]|nr:hypothetical protein [Deltaproteobacteria bacterium]